IRQHLGAQSVIPAKRGKKTWRVHGVRAEMRHAFPQRIYRRRALIESLFSSVKRKLSARAPGRSLRMQTRQALLLGLSFNLYRLKHRRLFLRMSTEPAYYYVISPDLQNSSSTFSLAQCANYNAQTNPNGFISQPNLLANTQRHESGSVASHYAQYVAAVNVSSNNPGTVAEQQLAA